MLKRKSRFGILSLTLVMAMLLTTLPSTLYVSAAETTVTDDFEDYTVGEKKTGPNAKTGVWRNSSVDKGWNDSVHHEVMAEPNNDTNKVFAFTGSNKSTGAVVRDGVSVGENDDVFTFSATLRVSAWNGESYGIRAMMGTDERSYYQLGLTPSSGGKAVTPSFRKYVSKDSKATLEHETTGECTDANQGNIYGIWNHFRFNITVSGNVVTASIKRISDQAGNVGEYDVYSYSFIDDSVLTKNNDGKIIMGMFASSDYYTYADDIKITSNELNGKLYEDVSGSVDYSFDNNAHIYNTDGRYTIDKVVLSGVTADDENPVTVYATESLSEEFENMGSLSEDGTVVNELENKNPKYIIISNANLDDDYEIKGIAILSEVSQIELTPDSPKKIFASIAGKDATDAVMKTDDTNVARVDGGLIKQSGFGETTLTVSNADGAISAKIIANGADSVKVTDDFEDYTVGEKKTGPNEKTGVWRNSSVDKGWNDSVHHEAMAEPNNDTNKVFAFTGSNKSTGAVVRDGVSVSEKDDVFTFSATLRASTWQGESYGIRAMMGTDERSYYQLGLTPSSSGKAVTPSFRKYVSKDSKATLEHEATGECTDASKDGIYGIWNHFRFNITVSGNVVTASIKRISDQAGNVGEYDVYSYSFIDDSVLSKNSDGKIIMGMFASSDYYTYADDIEITSSSSFVGSNERDNVIYLDAAKTAAKTDNVLEVGSGEIRKIVIDGLSGDADISVSKDGENWLYLTKATPEEGKFTFLNNITNYDYGFVKIASADYTDVKVYREVTSVTINKNTRAALVARIDCVETDEITLGDTDILEANGGVLLGKSEGSETVTIGDSANIEVTVKDADSIKATTNANTFSVSIGAGYLTKDAEYIVAEYDENGKLVAAQKIDNISVANDMASFTAVIGGAAAKAKILCWDNMTPLVDEYVIR